MLASVRRHPRLTFFSLGIATAVVSGAVDLFWYDIANGVFHLGVIYATRPLWLRIVMRALAWLPGVGLAAVIAGRLRWGTDYRPLAFVAGLAATYCVTVASLFAGPAIEEYRHERSFDRAAWLRNDKRDAMWPARLTMVDDMMKRRLLAGATRDSVERLLGHADQTEYFKDWDSVYWLGPERGLIRIDSEWLVIKFSSDGRVSDARLVRD
jgi:hypothetical protein